MVLIFLFYKEMMGALLFTADLCKLFELAIIYSNLPNPTRHTHTDTHACAHAHTQWREL